MAFGEWVARLGTGMGVTLDLDARGLCAMRYADGLTLNFELAPGGDELLLHSALAPVNTFAAVQRALCETLLCENHPAAGAGGEILALDPVTDEVVLSLRLDGAAAPGFEALEEAVRAFLARAREMRAALDQVASEASPLQGEDSLRLMQFIRA